MIFSFRSLLISSICLVMLSCFSVADESKKYTYANSFEPKYYVVLDELDSQIQFLDMISPAEYCGRDKMFYCVSSKQFLFAIPRFGYKNKKEWGFAGSKFLYEDERNIKIFGHTYVVSVIKSANNGIEATFLYSEERGLLGFKIQDVIEKGSKTFYLVDEVGFARR
ncbi:hypothetical protein [Microbulbifer sp. 2205BS26-8]|uniref:hypothetical protein n=1 Tax=Microbulbifer sp. 2205BS26-8 TaxID=3064386 RepID=UPI00273D6775|nr:hypothetical protein [Microbulbifer sp. 2205BS26-8]MDP5211202.1 hypothetical protein [Microbulbifer sp. 2205BS26-8]